MKRALRIFLYVIAVTCCSCSPKGGVAADPRFFSGSFSIDQTGKASFTDCATRIDMEIEAGGAYEKLRRDYANSTADEGAPVRIEFFGRISNRTALLPDSTTQYNPYNITGVEIRIDSILSLTEQPACLTDYIVAGLYRRVHEGEAEILRLRPDYSYTVENFATGNTVQLEEGEWYRTSELSLELKSDSTYRTTLFQIVPARESISGTGENGETVVYKKEWL